MKVAVVGAGSIGLGTAALLARQGHAVALWGRSLAQAGAPGSGVLEGTGAVLDVAGVRALVA